jgi:anti-sigma B factor antagonist
MQISVKPKDDFQIIHIEGHLDTNTAPDAEAAINKILDDGGKKLLIDFADVAYVSSAGLRVLLATAKKLKIVGGDMRLCGLNPTVQEVFDISGLSTIFSIFGNDSEALQ